MNALGWVTRRIDPVERYNTRKAKNPPSVPVTEADVEARLGDWVEDQGWEDKARIAEAAEVLGRDGAVRIRMPDTTIAMWLVRFWNGTGVIDSTHSGDTFPEGLGMRLGRRDFSRLDADLFRWVELEVLGNDLNLPPGFCLTC